MSETKTKPLTIKFSQREYQLLQERASANNMPLSTYAREKILFDVPQIEHHSFEFKTLKGISYCVGILSTFCNLKLSEQEMEDAEKEAKRIMIANGLDENFIKQKAQID